MLLLSLSKNNMQQAGIWNKKSEVPALVLATSCYLQLPMAQIKPLGIRWRMLERSKVGAGVGAAKVCVRCSTFSDTLCPFKNNLATRKMLSHHSPS